MKAYITGNKAGGNTPENFSEAEAKLTAEGYEVINPLRSGLPSSSPQEAKAALNILQLLGSDAVYLLPDWQSDTLAVIEKNIAEFTGKTILQEPPEGTPDVKQIIERIMGVTFAEICGRRRERLIVYARQIYAHHAREAGASLTEIGKEMAHNHTSVLYYLHKYEDDYTYTREFRKYAKEIEAQINGFLCP